LIPASLTNGSTPLVKAKTYPSTSRSESSTTVGGRDDQPSLAYKVFDPRSLGGVAFTLKHEPFYRIQELLLAMDVYLSDTSCLASSVYAIISPPHKYPVDPSVLHADRRNTVKRVRGSDLCCHNCNFCLRVNPVDWCVGVRLGTAATKLRDAMSAVEISSGVALRLVSSSGLPGTGVSLFAYVSVYMTWLDIVKNDPECQRSNCGAKYSTVAGRGFVCILLEGLLQLHVWETPSPTDTDPAATSARLGVSVNPCLVGARVRRGSEGLIRTWGLVPTKVGE
jgi:hypothetical protein